MFMWGYMRQAQMLWQEMIARDFFLNGLVNKREKDCAHRPWHVLERAGLPKSSKSAAQEQVQILTEFWNSARCVNAYDRNETGGVQRLIKQMMRSVSTRWSVHHIQWQPRTDRIGALFEWVPAYHFENRTGVLRFLPDTVGIEGQMLNPLNWMISAGDGLMISGSIGIYLKREALQDWQGFNEKFGTPGQLWTTSEGEDTPQGQAMKTAAQTFGSDWAGIIYNCPPGTKPLELIQANAGQILPFQELIDHIDKKLASLWRGGNLSSQSSKQTNETGASLQNEDARMIEETLATVEKTVLEWHYGPDVEVLAGISLEVPDNEDLKTKLQAAQVLVPMGMKIGVGEMREAFGFSPPADDEDTLTAPSGKDVTGNIPRDAAINEKSGAQTDNELFHAFADAVQADTEPARQALGKLILAKDPAEARTVLANIDANYPHILRAVLNNDAATEALAALSGEEAVHTLEQFTKQPA
jgi:phage gp29-like protein